MANKEKILIHFYGPNTLWADVGDIIAWLYENKEEKLAKELTMRSKKAERKIRKQLEEKLYQ